MPFAVTPAAPHPTMSAGIPRIAAKSRAISGANWSPPGTAITGFQISWPARRATTTRRARSVRKAGSGRTGSESIFHHGGLSQVPANQRHRPGARRRDRENARCVVVADRDGRLLGSRCIWFKVDDKQQQQIPSPMDGNFRNALLTASGCAIPLSNSLTTLT